MSWQRIKTITKTIQLIIYQWSVQCFHQWDEKRRKYQVFRTFTRVTIPHTRVYIYIYTRETRQRSWPRITERKHIFQSTEKD